METDTTNAVSIDRIWREVFEQGRLGVIHEVVHPEYTAHTPGKTDVIRDREELKQHVQGFLEAVRDISITVDDRITTEEVVVDRYTFRGVPVDECARNASAEATIEFTGSLVHHFEDGVVVTSVADSDGEHVERGILDVILHSDQPTGSVDDSRTRRPTATDEGDSDPVHGWWEWFWPSIYDT